jgi:hypothetical protein
MDQTEDILRLMEVGFGVREAIFVTTGILPLDVADSARSDYHRKQQDFLKRIAAMRPK